MIIIYYNIAIYDIRFDYNLLMTINALINIIIIMVSSFINV